MSPFANSPTEEWHLTHLLSRSSSPSLACPSPSLDPYQRPRMRDASIKSYMPAFPLGQPLTNFAVAKVIRAGEGAKVKTGEVVYGMEIGELAQFIP